MQTNVNKHKITVLDSHTFWLETVVKDCLAYLAEILPMDRQKRSTFQKAFIYTSK